MPCIFKWKCCYYCNCHRKWQYGHLGLTIEYIRFIPDAGSQDKKSAAISIKFEDIVDLKKTTTSLIYNAITIRDREAKHWFSSFSNVYDVVATIEHFWREKLVGKEQSDSDARCKNELFRLLYDSQDTLLDSAKQLHSQGQQLRKTSGKVTSIANDLGVAENFVSDLESWLGMWKTSKAKKIDLPLAQFEQQTDFFRADYAILLAHTEQESHKECILQFSSDNLLIKDKALNPLYLFCVREISGVVVHSPWDLTLTKAAIGKKGVNLHIISTRLPFILGTLERAYHYKPIYEDPPSADDENEINKDMGMPVSVTGAGSQTITGINFDRHDKENVDIFPELETEPSKTKRNQWEGSSCAKQSSSHQDIVVNKQVSEDDASEITTVLKNMKALALDIGLEQDRQLQEIDDMTSEIDRTNLRIQANNQRIKKLM